MAGPGYGVGFVQQASFVYSLCSARVQAGGNIGGRQSMGTTCMQLLLPALAAGLQLCKGYIACCVHFTHLYSISKPDCEGEAVLM